MIKIRFIYIAPVERIDVAESREFYRFTGRQPFEIEHRMYGLNLNPPVPHSQSISNQARIVAVSNDKLVAIVDVSIFKRNLALNSLEC